MSTAAGPQGPKYCSLSSHLRGPASSQIPPPRVALKARLPKPTITSTGLPVFGHPQPHGNTNLACLPVRPPIPCRRLARRPAGRAARSRPAPSEPRRRGAPWGSHMLARSSGPQLGGQVHGGCFWVRAPRPGRPAEALGPRAARAELPGRREEGCPGESCQGNLSNSSAPVPASCIIHGRRRDAGAAHLHRPGLHPPRLGAWRAKPSTGRGLCVTPRTRVPDL